MTERIGIKFTSLTSSLVDLYLNEAEAGAYPFAVYSYTPAPVMSKDGVHHYSTDLSVTIVGNSFDQAQTKANSIAAAVASGMQGPDFFAVMRESISDCVDGIWTITQTYTIKQYN